MAPSRQALIATISACTIISLAGLIGAAAAGSIASSVSGGAWFTVSALSAAIIARSRAATRTFGLALAASVIFAIGGFYSFAFVGDRVPIGMSVMTLVWTGITLGFVWPPCRAPTVRTWIIAGGVLAAVEMLADLGTTAVSLWNLCAGVGLHAWALTERAGGERARRRAAGLCEACAYDLRGLPADARCPECGLLRMPGAQPTEPPLAAPPDTRSWAEVIRGTPRWGLIATLVSFATGAVIAVQMDYSFWFVVPIIVTMTAFHVAGRPRRPLWLIVLVMLAPMQLQALGLHEILFDLLPGQEAASVTRTVYLVFSAVSALLITRSVGWMVALVVARHAVFISLSWSSWTTHAGALSYLFPVLNAIMLLTWAAFTRLRLKAPK